MCVSGINSTNAFLAFAYPVTMRTTPTSVDYANIQLIDGAGANAISTFALSSNSSPSVAQIALTGTGYTASKPYSVNATATTGYVGFNAEL